MSARLQIPFFGAPVQCDNNRRKRESLVHLKSLHPPRRYSKMCRCAEKNEWISRGIKFTHFCGKGVELLWKNFGFRSAWVANSVKEPLSRGKTFVKSFSSVWEEGLLLVRCSVFFAVISGVCLLFWYGQLKAKSYIEVHLLPSVCALLSDHIQRKLDFGRVRRISPLSITLESCSVGPHREEFSCGEVPSIKVRILPFASLRRGKIVIDAVLSNPTLLVAQKKDYTWLGIPFTEGTLQRHLSTEEGIDYRTKMRRIAREEAGARWDRERDDSAKQAAEMGYIVPEGRNILSEDDYRKENSNYTIRLATSEPFLCMDEKLHWRDHHCMDAGLEYDMRHSDLEKSFGAKAPHTGMKFWSRIIPGPIRQRFKRKANGRDLLSESITAKRKILQHSALAARAYFHNLSHGEFSSPTQSSEVLGITVPKSLGDFNASVSAVTIPDKDLTTKGNTERKWSAENGILEDTAGDLSGDRNLEAESNLDLHERSSDMELQNHENCSSLNTFSFIRDPFLFTLSRLTKHRNPREKFPPISSIIRTTESYSISDEYSEGDNIVKGGADTRTEVSSSTEQDGKNDASHIQDISSHSGLVSLDPSVAKHHSNITLPLSLKLSLPSFLRNVGQLWSHLLAGPVERLKSDVGPGVEDIVAELVDGTDYEQTPSIANKIPFVLDSVHFKGGTLMLLAYGDMEPS